MHRVKVFTLLFLAALLGALGGGLLVWKALPPFFGIDGYSPFNNSLYQLPKNQKEVLCLQAVGDILLARDIDLIIRRFGWQHPFAQVKELISQGDINFCNLESPASFLGSPYPNKLKNITFRANPANLFAIKDAGFNIISLANNHMADYGPAAIAETLDALQLLNLPYVGAGHRREEAYAPHIIEAKGWKLAFLAYAEPLWSVTEAGSEAGVAHLKKDKTLAAIQELKANALADLVVISLHWGEEYRHYPQQYQIDLAHAIVDAGADVILGHHPHVLQGLEWYRGKPVFYSLGNFFFDQIDDPTYQGALARINFMPDGGINVAMRPMRTQRRSLHQSIAQGQDAQMIAQNLIAYSSVFKTEAIVQTDGWLLLSPPAVNVP